jgi:hypothetical protein
MRKLMLMLLIAGAFTLMQAPSARADYWYDRWENQGVYGRPAVTYYYYPNGGLSPAAYNYYYRPSWQGRLYYPSWTGYTYTTSFSGYQPTPYWRSSYYGQSWSSRTYGPRYFYYNGYYYPY